MAKRKAVMKDIIYELDDDIEISSDEEVSSPKLVRAEPQIENEIRGTTITSEHNGLEVLSVDSTDESVCLIDSPKRTVNGGKTSDKVINIDDSELTKTAEVEEIEIVCDVKNSSDDKNTTIFNEDIVVDSPCDALCTAGCENRMSLVTVRFNNRKVSRSCRDKIKKFMIELIKEHQNDTLDSDNDTDYELDIWPDDLIEEHDVSESTEEEKQEVDENLFFVDTAPCDVNKYFSDIPYYSQVSSTISNKAERESPPKMLRCPTCFNCGGDHQLKDCHRPRDNARIAQNRQNRAKVGRYHVEDDQKYGHLIPGRISGALRHALGLKRTELPLYTYRMRLLGYPPGWLEEARISHSGITLFDSTGSATKDPEEEDGEICEAGSKDKYDIKKILDFPGFNVPASNRYKEEAYIYGLPPMSEQDSKIAMLQTLAPNAMKAYKRKKLTFFPSSANNSQHEGQAEMELDSGDEETAFPSVPPLPDEAPPPLPPPPELPPPPPEEPPPTPTKDPEPIKQDDKTEDKTNRDESNSDIEIVEESKVSETINLDETFITIDEDNDSDKASDRASPSLDDLEKKKRALLEALQNPTNEDKVIDNKQCDTKEEKTDIETENSQAESNGEISKETEINKESSNQDDEDNKIITSESVGNTEAKTGKVKTTSYGTPILNIASSYVKLPSDDKFAKDICDVINFENLPNSVGKYKQISSLLKKVKSEVDRIQES